MFMFTLCAPFRAVLGLCTSYVLWLFSQASQHLQSRPPKVEIFLLIKILFGFVLLPCVLTLKTQPNAVTFGESMHIFIILAGLFQYHS